MKLASKRGDIREVAIDSHSGFNTAPRFTGYNNLRPLSKGTNRVHDTLF
jgi:hypothetical protein